jgi:purine-binding chemotaxis protein CheW
MTEVLTSRREGTPLDVLTMSLQGELFAVPAGQVREILDLVQVTEVPGAPAHLNGLINVRGRVVALADLRLRLGMKAAADTIDSRIVVVDLELDGEACTVGLRADKVYEMAQIPAQSLTDAPQIGMRFPSQFVRCVGKRGEDFVLVLDVARILGLAEEDARGPSPVPRLTMAPSEAARQ